MTHRILVCWGLRFRKEGKNKWGLTRSHGFFHTLWGRYQGELVLMLYFLAFGRLKRGESFRLSVGRRWK